MPGSTLTMYQDALALRREHDLAFGAPEWLDLGPDTLAFRTGDVTGVVNFGTTPVAVPAGEVVLASGALEDGMLPRDTAVGLV